MSDLLELKLILNPAEQVDGEELDRLTRQLQQDILELEVEDVRPLEAQGAEGAKSGGSVEIGTLLVTALISGNVVSQIIDLLKSVLTRYGLRSVTLEIDGDKLEVKGISSREQQALIDAWMSRHPQILIARK